MTDSAVASRTSTDRAQGLVRRTIVSTLVLATGCGPSGTADLATECEGDSYTFARFQFPGGETQQTGCLPLDSPGVAVLFGTGCRTVLGAAAAALDSEHAVRVTAEASGAWFEREGTLTSGTRIVLAGTRTCTDPMRGCNYNQNDCSFEVLQAGHALGEVVELALAEPCEMLDSTDVSAGPRPVMHELHVRGPLAASSAGTACTMLP